MKRFMIICLALYLSLGGTQSLFAMGTQPPVAPQYVVSGNNVSAVIETRPFRLLIKDRNGQTVLASINSDIPLINPSCDYCEPDLMGNFWSLPPFICDRYAPLHFEIGGPEAFDFLDLRVAEPMQIYRNTRLYFAKDVVKVSASGKGKLFTLTTTKNDTTVDVLVEPDPSGVEAMRIKATVNNAKAQNVSFAFASYKNESFYGFGGVAGHSIKKAMRSIHGPWTPWDRMPSWTNTLFPVPMDHRRCSILRENMLFSSKTVSWRDSTWETTATMPGR